MNKFFRVVVIGFILIGVGCASSGQQINHSQIANLEKGKTTYTEVLTMFGQLQTVTNNGGDGTKAVDYVYTQHRVDGRTFIPFAGHWLGGSQTESESLHLTFDKNDILQEYSVSQSQYDTRNR